MLPDFREHSADSPYSGQYSKIRAHGLPAQEPPEHAPGQDRDGQGWSKQLQQKLDRT
jgi:hypothetical protein